MQDNSDEKFVTVRNRGRPKIYENVATISIGTSLKVIKSIPLAAKHLDILFMLCEKYGSVVTLGELASRMNTTEPRVRSDISSMRKKLHPNWSIQGVRPTGPYHKPVTPGGVRLIFSPREDKIVASTEINYDTALRRGVGKRKRILRKILPGLV